MKRKLTLLLFLLLAISLALCFEPTTQLKSPKVFASTNQNQASKQMPEDKQATSKSLEPTAPISPPQPTPETRDPSFSNSDQKPDFSEENNEKPKEESGLQEEVVPLPEENKHDQLQAETPSRKKVYLTFDDGPSPTTEVLLNILKEYQARATFFLLESRMNLFPHNLTRLASEGHSLGLHGVTHDPKLFYQSAESALAEMQQTQATLAKLTGITSFLVRTPFGSHPYMTENHKELMTKAGFIIWDWNVDSKDWYFKDARFVDYTIKQIKALEEKGIDPVILLHDNKYTINYLAQLLDYLKENHYEFAVLDPSMEPITF